MFPPHTTEVSPGDAAQSSGGLAEVESSEQATRMATASQTIQDRTRPVRQRTVGLLAAGGAETAAVLAFHLPFLEGDFGLALDDAELANLVALLDSGVAHCDY